MNVPRYLDFQPSDAPEKHEPRDLRVLYPEACETQLQPTTYNLHTICPQGTLFTAAIMEHKLQAVRKASVTCWNNWFGLIPTSGRVHVKPYDIPTWMTFMRMMLGLHHGVSVHHGSTLPLPAPRMSPLLQVMWTGALMRKLVQMVCSYLAAQ